jgi:hypothetical protein
MSIRDSNLSDLMITYGAEKGKEYYDAVSKIESIDNKLVKSYIELTDSLLIASAHHIMGVKEIVEKAVFYKSAYLFSSFLVLLTVYFKDNLSVKEFYFSIILSIFYIPVIEAIKSIFRKDGTKT